MSATAATLLAAFIGAGSALLVLIIQRHLDRREKVREQVREKRAVARAVMFEIVSFYRYYYTHLRPLLQNYDPQSEIPPPISAPTSEFFSIYHLNADRLTDLDEATVEMVVRFYGLAEWLLSTIQEYGVALEHELQREHSVSLNSAPAKLLKQIQTTMWEADRAAVDAGRKLAEIAGVSHDPFAKLS